MSIEEFRGNGSPYYYHVCRDEWGNPRKRYLGKGVLGGIAARNFERLQAQRKKDRRALQAYRQLLVEPDRLVARLQSLGDLLTEAYLYAAGFHRPNYGPWRKKR